MVIRVKDKRSLLISIGMNTNSSSADEFADGGQNACSDTQPAACEEGIVVTVQSPAPASGEQVLQVPHPHICLLALIGPQGSPKGCDRATSGSPKQHKDASMGGTLTCAVCGDVSSGRHYGRHVNITISYNPVYLQYVELGIYLLVI